MVGPYLKENLPKESGRMKDQTRSMKEQLNLPLFIPRLRQGKSGKEEIFDPYRKRFVRLTPEEWVRQHFLNFMTVHLGYPPSLIVVEAALLYHGLKKRADILAYSPAGKPFMIVECKSPATGITQEVFDQAAMYNMTLHVPCLVVTNGKEHYACEIDRKAGSYRFLKEVPGYGKMDG